MWQILRVEFEYTKLGILIAYAIGLLLLVFNNLYGLMAQTSTILIIALVIIGVMSSEEKRNRLYARLPMPIKTIGLARLLFVLVFQTGMILLWLILFWLEPPAETTKAICTMVGINGFWVGVIIVLLLWHDLGHFGTPKYQMLLLAACGTTAIGYTWFIFHRFNEVSGQQIVDRFLFYQSPQGATLVSLIFIGLLYLSVVVFAKRCAYLA